MTYKRGIVKSNLLDRKHNNKRHKEARSRVYKTVFVLNSVEHEVLNAHKYKKSIHSAFLSR